jgi:hypothetical protein
VGSIRRLVAQRYIATLVCAAALLVRLLIPGGYMVSEGSGWPTIVLCPQAGPAPLDSHASAPVITAHGERQDMMQQAHTGDHIMSAKHGRTNGHGKAEMPCVFTALSAAVLAATDPILLAALIAFIVATAFTGILLPRLAEPARIRPPLRGPPAVL